MSEKGSNGQFINYNRHLCVPFVFFLDFETNLKEVQKINKNNSDECYTFKYQDHIACSNEYELVCFNDFLMRF